MIIVNEKEYAQIRLKNHDVGDNVYITLAILAKYYYAQGLKRKGVCKELQSFLELSYPKYFTNKSYWTTVIEDIAKKNAKTKLFISDGVWVTENEWNTIQEFNSKVIRKLAFTLLCIAKINNQKNENDSCWVNTEIKDIFKMANIACSVDLRSTRLGILIKSGFIKYATRIDNLSIKVLAVDEDSKQKFVISDFRDLGNEYLYRAGENFIRCAECGKLTRNNRNNTKKYCKSCASYTPQGTKQVECIDCGKIIIVHALNNKTCRCENCQHEKDRENAKIRKQRQRNREKSRQQLHDSNL